MKEEKGARVGKKALGGLSQPSRLGMEKGRRKCVFKVLDMLGYCNFWPGSLLQTG